MNALLKKSLWVLVTPVLVAGCVTASSRGGVGTKPVVAGPDEVLAVKQVLLLVDASSSLSRAHRFADEKKLVQSFVGAMPTAQYSVGVIDFAGKYPYSFNGDKTNLVRRMSRVKRPLSPFNRTAVAEAVDNVAYVGYQTPMEVAFMRVGENLEGTRGKTAIVIFSDGYATRETTALTELKKVASSYRSKICVYAIQVGDEQPTSLMRSLASATGCGAACTEGQLRNARQMESFVHKIMFEKIPDSDGDGVLDNKDKCPNTPKGVKVDKNGCPLDSDGDGVPDYKDKCPRTPKGVKVDKNGCPLDSDGDGVPDYKDKCPNTPKGVKVDKNGCPLDSDGDGVPDNKDKCPGTPKGVKVNKRGCPLDSDHDGVPDYKDKCPGTLRGATVDARGCWTLPTAYFDYDKYTLKSKYAAKLNDVVQVLKKNPKIHIRIEGHTDSRGSDAYNLKLSERRANAVKDYLASHGVKTDRLSIKGFGESRPAVPNTSEANMAKNRRVELTVVK